MPEKFYSVEEANALVPKLKPLLERIRATQEALGKDKTLAAVREKASQRRRPPRPPSVRAAEDPRARHAPAASFVLALIFLGLRSNGFQRVATEHNRENAGRNSDDRHPEEDQRRHAPGHRARGVAVHGSYGRDSLAFGELVERRQGTRGG